VNPGEPPDGGITRAKAAGAAAARQRTAMASPDRAATARRMRGMRFMTVSFWTSLARSGPVWAARRSVADRDDLPPQGLPLSLLSDLMGQIRCDFVQFQGFDSRRQGSWFIQAVPDEGDHGEPDGDLDQAHWRHYWDSAACSYPDRTGDLRSVVKIADFYSVRQWRSTGMYADVYRPQGLQHELQLCLPEPPGPARGPGRTVRLYLFRFSGPDFSERDRAILTLIRPHLHHAYLDAERRRAQGLSAHSPAVGPASPGGRRAHQCPGCPAAWRVRGHRAHAPGEHLRPAPGDKPHRRRAPRLPRSGGAGPPPD
jgi:hypothetical protein